MLPILLPLIAQAAPDLVKYFTGSDKAAKVVGQVANIAKTVAGVDDVAEAVQVIQADPAKLLDFKERCLDREADLEKAYLADIDSARKMQIAALAQDDLFSKRFVYYFAIGWSSFAGIYFFAVTFQWFGGLSSAGTRIADTILGVLIGTVITGFFNFFYGSSARSQRKDDLIQELTRK